MYVARVLLAAAIDAVASAIARAIASFVYRLVWRLRRRGPNYPRGFQPIRSF